LEKGLFQRQLAKLIGVDEMTIVNWEKDRTKPKEKYIERMVSLFGVRSQSLLQLGK